LVFTLDVAMLVLLGIAFRVLAFVSLVAFNRDKRGLPTLAQMSLYWVVNPLDDWARARGERAEQVSRRARIESHHVSSAQATSNRSRAGTDNGSHGGSGSMVVGSSGEEEFFVASSSSSSSSSSSNNNNSNSSRGSGSGSGPSAGVGGCTSGGYAAPAGRYDLYPELDYPTGTEEL
jgi:hypothetical protein